MLPTRQSIRCSAPFQERYSSACLTLRGFARKIKKEIRLRMQISRCPIYWLAWPILLGLVFCLVPITVEHVSAASALYWCPHRSPDQQYSAAPGPGCTPLAEKPDKPAEGAGTPQQEIRAENLQTEISNFLRDYRQFIDCCSTDIDSLKDLKELEERANHLLLTAQTVLFSEQMKLRGFTLREIIPPVAQARDNLKTLKSRLEAIEKAQEKVDELGYEAAGRERRRIRDEEEAIKKEFQPTLPPESARTGCPSRGRRWMDSMLPLTNCWNRAVRRRSSLRTIGG